MFLAWPIDAPLNLLRSKVSGLIAWGPANEKRKSGWYDAIKGFGSSSMHTDTLRHWLFVFWWNILLIDKRQQAAKPPSSKGLLWARGAAAAYWETSSPQPTIWCCTQCLDAQVELAARTARYSWQLSGPHLYGGEAVLGHWLKQAAKGISSDQDSVISTNSSR